ncbi:MAG: PBP1A family penicillin-binding protein [Candidatus Wallbacteria bacterium]|nr:PBP1A family penicillin-binding protein [Candidatus Wallbacteria bacterium]
MSHLLWSLFQTFVQSVLMPFAVLGFVHLLCAIHGKDRLERELPSAAELARRPALETRVLDRNGVLLATLRDEQSRSELVPLADIPLLTRLAFVAVEDERFFQHDGIDPKAIVRAAVKNLRAGGLVEGGSTITQQLVKNRFLTSERSLDRKLKEFLLALKMERIFSKEEILCQYLNEIYFGQGVYGIGAAARSYFGKPASSLTLGESAILAGMVKAPNRYNPFRPNEAWRERQRLVLGKLVELGYVSPEQARQAEAEPPRFARGLLPGEAPEKAPYFVSQVKRWLIDTYGFKTAFTGGLRVTTTLDWRIQQQAERAFLGAAVFKNRPESSDPTLQGAFVALDPASGDVLSMIGGRGFATSQFNRAVQARRQPGSSFKPFVYCAALFEGLEGNTVIDDEPVAFEDQAHVQLWEPRNSGNVYNGPTTLAEALARSFNAVAVKLLDQVGILDTVEIARRLGIATPLHNGLSLALGASEVTLMEMVSAYSVFGNRGMRALPRTILKVEDYDGKLLQLSGSDQRDAIDEVTAFSMTQMLRGVVERGTGRAARVEGHPVAGKTGTTNGYVDAWFIGFTPRIAAGCYVGHDDRKRLGGNATGGRVAAPIVGAFLNDYLKGREPVPFQRPATVDLIQVCGETGMLASEDCEDTWEIAFDQGRAPGEECEGHEGMAYEPPADEDDMADESPPPRPWMQLPESVEATSDAATPEGPSGVFGAPSTEDSVESTRQYARSLRPWAGRASSAQDVRARIRRWLRPEVDEQQDDPPVEPPPQ